MALLLIPQSMAYAQLAGLPAVHGLYAAAVAPPLAALAGSSPYLQTGPVAMTSLLTLGALAPVAAVGSAEFAAHAALLAVVVGVVRVALSVLRAGALAYLLSEPAIHGFTAAGALLIVASQVPALVDRPSVSDNPLISAAEVLTSPPSWELAALAVGAGTAVFVILTRRLGALFPAVPLVAAAGVLVGSLSSYPAQLVGPIPRGLPLPSADLMWTALPAMIVPGVVIAVIGFAESVVVARRYATQERQRWSPGRELLGQGLANVAAGACGGYPVGGSLSRSAVNKAAGATSRWSGAITGLVVLSAIPVAGVLAPLPRAVLAGLVIAATLSLVDLRPLLRSWRLSPLQGCVGAVTFAATVAAAPRIDRGVMVGVVLAVGIHLWRELKIEVVASMGADGVLHVRPRGVLYYASAPTLADHFTAVLADHPGARRVVLHLDGLGRMDLSGVLALRALLDEGVELPVTLSDVPAHAQRLVSRVMGGYAIEPPGAA